MTQLNRPFLLYLFLVTCIAALLPACDSLDIHNPGDFEYPLSLTVQKKQSVAELTWSAATVSTFEEYIILRSTGLIPDDPEPVVSGNVEVIARLDDRSETTFKDSNLPITDTVYYKVYARISGHLLMSPTVAFVQHLHLLQARADIVDPIIAQNAFVAFDRATQRLFVYNYESREIITSKIYQFNFPVISYDASTSEVFISDNGTSQFLDFNSLNIVKTINAGSVRSAKYLNGWLYVMHGQFPYTFALYRRSDASLRAELNPFQVDWRVFGILPDAGNPNAATIYDFGQTGSARYVQSGTALQLDLLSSDVFNNGSTAISVNPVRQEFVISSTGQITDSNLQDAGRLSDGLNGFTQYACSPDGSRLFAMTFQNTQVVQVYDTGDDYALIETYSLSNQISPVAMFADGTNVYVLSLVFLGGGTQTLITAFEY